MKAKLRSVPFICLILCSKYVKGKNSTLFVWMVIGAIPAFLALPSDTMQVEIIFCCSQ